MSKKKVISIFEHILHGVEKGAVVTAKVAVPLALSLTAPEILAGFEPLLSRGKLLPSGATQVTQTVLQIASGGNDLNPLEQFAITMILGTLQTVVKNPAHAAALKGQLLFLADDIYMTYGIQPPQRTPALGATVQAGA